MSRNTSSTAWESSFRADLQKTSMPTTPAVAVIGLIRDLIEADTVFFRLAVALPEPLRGRVIGNRSRMTHDVLTLMRIVLEAPPAAQQRFVVNIPLGGDEWGPPAGGFVDVPVIPTAEQLAAGMENNIVDPAHDATCAICQEGVMEGTRLRNCHHWFHQECITQWYRTSARCPVCRDDIRVRRSGGPPAPTPSDE